MPGIPILGRLRQQAPKSAVSLGYENLPLPLKQSDFVRQEKKKIPHASTQPQLFYWEFSKAKVRNSSFIPLYEFTLVLTQPTQHVRLHD